MARSVWRATVLTGVTLGVMTALLTPPAVAVEPQSASHSAPRAVADPGPAGMSVAAVVSVGGSPGQPLLDEAGGRVYVPDGDSPAISVVDTTSDQVVTTLRAPRRADGVDALLLDTRRGRLFAVADGVDVMVAFDTATGQRLARLAIGDGYHATALDEARSRLYVLSIDSGTIHVINTRTLRVVTAVAAPRNAASMALDSTNGLLYVDGWTTSTDVIRVIDVRTWRTVGTINGVTVGGGAMTLDVPAGRLYASAIDDEDPGTMWVIDTVARRVVTGVTVGMWPGRPVLDPVAQRIYLATNNEAELYVFDTRTTTEVGRIDTLAETWTPTLDAARSRLFAVSTYGAESSALAMVDTTTDLLIGRLPLTDAAGRPVLDAAGTRAYVAGSRTGILTVVTLPVS